VERREAKKQAKDDYKAKKKTAKQEYKEEKKEADANLKAARQPDGVQHDGHAGSSGK
jgi:F0F1-type ATP synthase membrane subunit b/b'